MRFLKLLLPAMLMSTAAHAGMIDIAGQTFSQDAETIELSGTEDLADLSPLKDLRSVRRVFIEGASVTGLGPLAGLRALEESAIDDTQVADLSPLSALPGPAVHLRPSYALEKPCRP
ncbi:hypothetical protein GAO09_06455 [Rhizobiales bacterium RZME27]|jgi:hypothetical protein|uniref:Leucine-rich repeat domain-containing protein n=1 Tax=Endobacterium cereale TaxID=2663029 RepID=A0A6A8AA68_9HYPH|nr:hypothetical protein [Endobacterium cereale]MEB2846266.1 hypothetical protein [Endobacterium cereale]MQY45701.1 hypothetical protein [Endobacterium cereale]